MKIKIIYVVITLVMISTTIMQGTGITFELNGGRWGDSSITYLKCKALSDKYKIPLYYKNYAGDQFFPFSQAETLLNTIPKGSVKLQKIKNLKQLENNAQHDNVLLVSTLYTNIDVYDYCQKNPPFHQEIQKLFEPKHKTKIINIPSNKITVAVHIRKGGGFDAPLLSVQEYKMDEIENFSPKKTVIKKLYADKRHPLKFPPNQYYIDSIKQLSHALDNDELFIQIFTDAQEPEKLLTKIQSEVNLPNIEWGTTLKKHNFRTDFVDDFYNMTKFDCLIRPNSAFSIVAQIVGDFKCIIYPETFKWIDNTLIITKSAFIKNI